MKIFLNCLAQYAAISMQGRKKRAEGKKRSFILPCAQPAAGVDGWAG